jgi:HSP20 family molecular chaperone IbpA
MPRVPSLSSPFLLGFDEIERALDRVTKAADGYPPYNIERMAREDGRPERLRITLAVAGFARDELDVTIEESQLVIRGRQNEEQTRQYLHRGIAARQFQRTFVLADGMEVLGAAASKIRSFRPPEPYKGKGIKYVEETILRKAGKTAGK